MLTAVGILSIIVAALSGLASAGSVLSSVVFYTASKTMAVSTTTTSTTTATGTVTVTGTTTAPTTTSVAFNPFQMDAATLILSVSTAVLSLAAAIVLMIAGIQLLRDAPSSRRLHWIFVMVKIPLAIVAAVAQWLIYSSMMSGITATTPGGTTAAPGLTSWIMIIQALVGMAVSLAYPLTLIFVLQGRTARQYFDSLAPVPVSLPPGHALR